MSCGVGADEAEQDESREQRCDQDGSGGARRTAGALDVLRGFVELSFHGRGSVGWRQSWGSLVIPEHRTGIVGSVCHFDEVRNDGFYFQEVSNLHASAVGASCVWKGVMGLSRKLSLGVASSLLAAGATLGIPQVSEAAPATISCAYGHVCGVDWNGLRFDFYKCGVNEPIGLSGPGEFYNHQTPGTAVKWLRANGQPWGVASSGSSGYIDWTDIWFVRAC
jgi:hypothetical protein